MASNSHEMKNCKGAVKYSPEEEERYGMATEDTDLDYPEIDPVYATVTSNVSGYSTDSLDPGWAENQGFKGGLIQFKYDHAVEDKGNTGYYVSVPDTADADDIAIYMAKVWKLRTPNIILSVITSFPHYKRWKDQKQVEDFQDGIREAANTTEMWILTNGLDSGITKIIGDAIREEKQRREIPITKVSMKFMSSQTPGPLPKLTLIGVVPKAILSYSSKIEDKPDSHVNILNMGEKLMSEKKELNPDHTHYIMQEDTTDMKEFENFRIKLEERFLTPVGRPKRYRRITNLSDSALNVGESVPDDLPVICSTSTPMVGLLIQGGPMEIDHVAELLKRKVPVVVMKGTGLAADLLAFCYLELQERSHTDHIESYLKPELIKKLMKHFPSEFKDDELARNRCRDRILECAQNARQGQQKFLTILETDGVTSDLKNLDKYILLALFESQALKKGRKFQEQFQSDLKLTLDWNRSDLALSQIFEKYDWARIKINHELFDRALLKNSREDFVELFLQKNCIQVHKYLNHRKLLYLFNNIETEDFFLHVCLEGVLAKPIYASFPLSRDFVVGEECDLNQLLYKVTKLENLVSSYELSMNAVGDYVTNQIVAERRALNALVFWSALTFNPKLTKVLWKRTEDPMAMAVIVSMIWNNLAKNWCRDLDTKRRLKACAIEFGKMAVKLLDLTYKDSSLIAINALDKKLSDFNDKTVIQIAHIARNKHFIAHSSCQKWLNKRWHGKIRIRAVEWGPFKFPDWLKIYLSVLLVFPMFIWVTYDANIQIQKKSEEVDSDEDINDEDAMMTRPFSLSEKWHKKKGSMTHHVKRIFDYGRENLKVPCYLQFYYLWSAPVTKFWISQLFYVLYLILFSVAVIFPSCGNVHMDFAVFGWTLLIWIEIIRGVITKKKKYLEISVLWTNVEIVIMGAFLVLFCFVRIVPHFVSFIDYMTTKFVMSLGLLYFYYRTLTVFLPISPVLGPMLISIRRMIKNDFLTWMRMFLIIMVSGGISIHAVLYPNYPVTIEGIRTALSRAFFALFLTKIDDLDGDERCSFLYKNTSLTHCRATYSSDNIFSKNASNVPDMTDVELSKCSYSSWGGYFVVIQYLVITKLVLVTLLYALFSVTNSKVSGESEEIWKFQKYSLIVDFEEKLRLPPPLSIISYICMIIICIAQKLHRCCKKCCSPGGCARCTCKRKKDKHDSKKIRITKEKRSEDFSYWKSCVRDLLEAEEMELAEKDRAKTQSKILQNLVTQNKKQKDFNGKLTEQIAHLANNVTTCNLALENIKHLIEQLDPKNKMRSLTAATVHVSCRQSPYPNTMIQRFPVFDKHVPWEVTYLTYDPVHYTCPIEDFPEKIQPLVDPDFLQINKDIDEMRLSKEDVRSQTQRNPLFEPLWNVSATFKVENIPVPVQINRTSWICRDGIPCRYNIDKTGLPLNPMGRTGLRGRGNLCRYGPNHNVLVVVSRWKRKYGHGDQSASDSDFIVVEGKRVLEMIVIQRIDTGEYTLPGGSDYGNRSMYSAVCQKFVQFVLEDKTEIGDQMTEQDMIEYFSQYSVDKSDSSSTMTSGIIYKDYIDDPWNTDNAWREAEVWNFHYRGGSILDTKVKKVHLADDKNQLSMHYINDKVMLFPMCCTIHVSPRQWGNSIRKSNSVGERLMMKERKWKEASSYTKLFGNQDSIVREAALRHGAYY